MTPEGEKRRFAFVLVHGIGNVRRGSVLNEAVQATRRIHPGLQASVDGSDEKPPEAGQVGPKVSRIQLVAPGERVEISEIHWADVFGKVRLRQPFRMVWRIANLFFAAPQVPLLGLPSRAYERVAKITGGALAVSFVVMAVAFLWSCYEEGRYFYLKHFREPGLMEGFLRDFLLPGWTNSIAGQIFLSIPIVVLLIALLTAIAWLLTEVIRYARRKQVGRILVYQRIMMLLFAIYLGIAALLLTIAFAVVPAIARIVEYFFPARVGRPLFGPGWLFGDSKEPEGPKYHSVDLLGVLNDIWPKLAIMAALLIVILVAVNLLRDVIFYLYPRGTAAEQQRHIRRVILETIDRLTQAGYEKVIIVSHSLGTVITIDALLEYVSRPGENCTLRLSLVTAGSPIRRLINRILPNRLPPPEDILARLSARPNLHLERWLNVYRIFDYVGQALTYSALPLLLTGRPLPQAASEAKLIEMPVRPLTHLPCLHTDYWGDSRFVSLVADAIAVGVETTTQKVA